VSVGGTGGTYLKTLAHENSHASQGPWREKVYPVYPLPPPEVATENPEDLRRGRGVGFWRRLGETVGALAIRGAQPREGPSARPGSHGRESDPSAHKALDYGQPTLFRNKVVDCYG